MMRFYSLLFFSLLLTSFLDSIIFLPHFIKIDFNFINYPHSKFRNYYKGTGEKIHYYGNPPN